MGPSSEDDYNEHWNGLVSAEQIPSAVHRPRAASWLGPPQQVQLELGAGRREERGQSSSGLPGAGHSEQSPHLRPEAPRPLQPFQLQQEGAPPLLPGPLPGMWTQRCASLYAARPWHQELDEEVGHEALEYPVLGLGKALGSNLVTQICLRAPSLEALPRLLLAPRGVLPLPQHLSPCQAVLLEGQAGPGARSCSRIHGGPPCAWSCSRWAGVPSSPGQAQRCSPQSRGLLSLPREPLLLRLPALLFPQDSCSAGVHAAPSAQVP